MIERIDIIGSEINITDMNNIVKAIQETIEQGRLSKYICVSNVHTVVSGVLDKKFQDVTNKSYFSIPDGMPLYWYGKIKGYKGIGRCAGPDLMGELFKLSEKRGYTHYFYGGTEETLKKLKLKLKVDYPALKVVGFYSPPFRELSKEEDDEIVKIIDSAKADIVWVGLGAPKQEFWMSNHQGRINTSLLIGVGAGFNFHAGTIQRAPKIMQKLGLEWFYRLVKEPRRLWKRYLVTNFLFLYFLITKQGKNIFK